MEKEVKIKNFPNLRTVYLTGEINADALQQFKKDLDLLIEADNEIFNDNVRSLADVNPELSKAYKEHAKFPPLILDITSPGGSVYAALALYDIIRNYNLNSNHKIIARATGLIASAATIIILACDERECGKNSTFMVHSISTYNAGKLQDVEDDIKETVRLSEAVKNIYTERTNITLKKLKEVDKLKQDWFMTADEAREDVRNVDDRYYPESNFAIRDKEDNEILSIIDSLQQEESEVWVKIDAEHPLPYCQEVIGYNKEWVDEDFNPSGTRVGFLTDTGFFSAKWVNDQDCYTTCYKKGDDYKISQMLPDGTRKTWCKYENGEAVEGYLPNMPTHFMLIPKTPDGFTWPYNIGKER